MEEIQYIGETLWPRIFGEGITLVSFCTVLFAVIAYGKAIYRPDSRIAKIAGRQFFIAHGVATLTLIGLMLYVMLNKHYEYMYAFEHVSNDLPLEYLFSAFWEGQQGSFLLWMFWHIILGLILIKKAKEWEPGVLLVLSIIQLWLSSMLLGIYVPGTDFKIGDNPMMLLREVVDAPVFANEDYLQLIEGKGLNILLQNYWNVIHPPITFLGFASVAIPFAFAVTGLLRKKYTEWMRPALPWVLFSVGVLGVGILMGSAWAYEALTFGGYWAWDPVENMSLVPWIMLLAGLHAHLITQATGYSRKSVYLFYILAFCLSVYSTYLVRSGALEDTSVHAFTEMGMGAQLTTFLLFFILGSGVLLSLRWKRIPTPIKEESGYSKEFWMFIGLLILAISSILITYSTSLPVVNKIVQIFKPEYEGMVINDANEHYNKYQLWIGVFVAILSGFSQWARYGASTLPKRKIQMRMIAHVLVTVVGTLGVMALLNNPTWPIITLTAAGIYGIVANFDYLFSHNKFNIKMAGSAMSHVGFAVMLLGIIFSGINKRHISSNPQLMAGLFNEEEGELGRTNVILLKNEPIFSQGYLMEYERDSFIGTERQYFVSIKELNQEGKPIDSFMVNPNVIYTKTFDDVAAYNPSIRKSLKEDVFTRIATLPRAEVDNEFAQSIEDSLDYIGYTVIPGDTIELAEFNVYCDSVIFNPPVNNIPVKTNDKVVALNIRVENKKEGKVYPKTLHAILRGNLSYVLPEKLNEEELRLKVSDTILFPLLPEVGMREMESFTVEEGSTVEWNDYQVKFNSFVREAKHPFYEKEADDIAIGASFIIESDDGTKFKLNPTFVIRGKEVRHYDAYSPKHGVWMRFESINPSNETVKYSIQKLNNEFKVYIAENVPRTDFIVVEALAFPGINLFWLGSCLMLFGVFFSWWQRRLQRKR